MPIPWASFNEAHKRIQAGGWAREVTTKAFPVSKDIAGVKDNANIRWIFKSREQLT